ncbi:MAG TPA: Stf0 family sulfotransferase [Bauldia sp.]|nr:Stf0 family sulfotransferase [Bauldia sp.]
MNRAPPPDWRPPDRLIAIAASPRSGTSMLGTVMAQTGSLGIPHEWLHVGFSWPPSVTELPNSTVEQCCRLLLANGLTPNGVGAVKLFGIYFVGIVAEIDFPRWFPNVSWVWLRRRDLLRQAVSLAFAWRSGKWTSTDGGPATVSYSSSLLRHCLKSLLLHDGVWRGYFAGRGVAPLPLWYEDVADRLEDTVRAIAAHAGVPLAREPDESRLKLRRQATEENERWVERFLAEPDAAGLIARLDAARGLSGTRGSA